MIYKTINIKGLESYKISECGSVINSKGIERKHSNNGAGYPFVQFFAKKKQKLYTVHRMVALTHLDQNGFKIVNHKDGNKLNFHVSNLEWTSHSLNSIHSVRVLGNKNHLKTCFKVGNKVRHNYLKSL